MPNLNLGTDNNKENNNEEVSQSSSKMFSEQVQNQLAGIMNQELTKKIQILENQPLRCNKTLQY